MRISPKALLASSILSSTLLAGGIASSALAAPAAAKERVANYELTSTEGNSKFEGIGADERRGRFYVSEVTGGEIHRGFSGVEQTEEWLAGDGTDGRYTARGIAVDAQGNVYIAGGPNGLGNERPDLWVYSPAGELLAALKAPGDDVFLNDVTIGADGAAYFTNSNDPQIFRVAASDGEYSVELWADAGELVERREGFNLGGIVLSADQSAFIVAQGNTGKLFRFEARTGKVSEIDTTGLNLVNADGLLREGNRLSVVQNFSRLLTELQVSADGTEVRQISQRATDPQRVLTTVAKLRGQNLYVDSKFDETVATGPFQVITEPLAD
ncbi:gluconolaconase [Glutamicibacter sp. PS]|uniref:SMP-30/gluconolactonase/LRE family protein n=1 Tax=Glutamicibacter sp. PS TaxID=3075634 RepID=UPI00283B6F6A|nr:gluconolaconase [Glutamicibacter sp. PS]MDR4533738.1 gluconolaconase [Glutamicibacter sp. PS]